MRTAVNVAARLPFRSGNLLQVLRRLESLVESEGSPSSDLDLVFMTRLMQLAVGARGMLRERQYHFPGAADHLLKTFYPILSTFILEVQLREPEETDGEPPPQPPPLPARSAV